MNVCRPLARWGSSTLGSSFNMEEDEIRALQRPPHLLDFGPLTPSELVNHLECMPRQFAEIVACRFRWMLRSLRIAWMWFCFEVFPLQLYFDTLVHAIAEYPEPEDTRHYSLYLSRYDCEYIDYQLLDWSVRFDCSAESITWWVTGRHLPCWEILLRRARIEGLHE